MDRILNDGSLFSGSISNDSLSDFKLEDLKKELIFLKDKSIEKDLCIRHLIDLAKSYESKISILMDEYEKKKYELDCCFSVFSNLKTVKNVKEVKEIINKFDSEEMPIAYCH